MVEKVVRSLQDLEDALSLAVREGGCRIRVGDRVAALLPQEELNDGDAEQLLSHPIVGQRLDRAVRSLDAGLGIPHEDVVKRLGVRKV